MPEITVRTNFGDFVRQLREAGAKIERRAVTNAVRAAGRVFRDAARAAAPVLREPDPRRLPGALRRAITVLRSKQRQRGVVEFYVSVRAGKSARRTARDPYYWRFLEAGWIPRGPGNRLRGGARRKALERSRSAARRVAYPFLAPSFQRVQGQALQAFEQRLEQEVERIDRER